MFPQLSLARCSWHCKPAQRISLNVYICYCHLKHVPLLLFIIGGLSRHFPHSGELDQQLCRNPSPDLVLTRKAQLCSKTSLWETNVTLSRFLPRLQSLEVIHAPFSRAPCCHLLPPTQDVYFRSHIQRGDCSSQDHDMSLMSLSSLSVLFNAFSPAPPPFGEEKLAD